MPNPNRPSLNLSLYKSRLRHSMSRRHHFPKVCYSAPKSNMISAAITLIPNSTATAVAATTTTATFFLQTSKCNPVVDPITTTLTTNRAPTSSISIKTKRLPMVTSISATATPLSASSELVTTPKRLKSRLSSGKTLYGMFLLSSSPTLAEIAGLAGYDYVVVDMEHGPGGISNSLPCLRALEATGTAVILRLPESTAAWTKKALDLGPQGIMFPMIESPSAASAAVSFCRYPPRGVRGAAHSVVRASGYGIDEGYLENYEDGLLVMVQVESGSGMEQIEAISAVDGVDCVQMGPLDLSASLGYLWKPGHKKVIDLLMEGERKVLDGGKSYLGGFAMPHDPPEEMKKRGYHLISGAVDLGMFRQACVDDVTKFRRATVAQGESGNQGDGNEEAEGYWSE